MGTASTPLKRERERQGLAAETVATAVGVSQPTIHRIERGLRRASPNLAKKISAFFENRVTRDQILFPEEYKSNPEKQGRKRHFQEAV